MSLLLQSLLVTSFMVFETIAETGDPDGALSSPVGGLTHPARIEGLAGESPLTYHAVSKLHTLALRPRSVYPDSVERAWDNSHSA